MKSSALLSLLLLAVPAVLSALPNSMVNDRRIEREAKSSYNYRVVLDGRVQVSADDGVLTLTGTVQDEEEKSLAADTVKNISGTEEIQNHVLVRADYAEHSDAWIAAKIRSRLLVKANVTAADTTVTVQAGIVTLTGVATSLAQKELTGVLATGIAGVKSVQNNLVIQSASPPAAAELIDDASITSQVRVALLSHASTQALQPRISTRDGVVQITGHAGSESEKAIVTQLARDVRGTRSVINAMLVRG